MDLGERFSNVFISAKRRANITKQSTFARAEIEKSSKIADLNNQSQGGFIKLRFWPDSTFSYLTTRDTGRYRRILAPTGDFEGVPTSNNFL